MKRRQTDLKNLLIFGIITFGGYIMDNLSEKELLKLIILQNQVILEQGNYIARLAYGSRHVVRENGFTFDMSGPEDKEAIKALFEKTNKLIKHVNDTLWQDESNKTNETNSSNENIQHR